jgi:DNA-binding transcriptional MerR regulator
MRDRPDADRLTIGQFAGLARLSIKALRLYDRNGLLRPAAVDRFNRFRYYIPEQLDRARRISQLRAVGMPLAEIAAVLDAETAGGDPAALIRGYWQRIDAQHTARRRLARYLVDLFTNPEEDRMPAQPIQTRDVPEQKVLSITRRTLVAALPGHIDTACTTMLKHLGDSGAENSGPAFVIYHGEVNEESDGPVEVCLPVRGTVEPAGEISLRIEPAHTEAYSTLTKGEFQYPALLQVYDELNAWIVKRGAEATGAPREVYFADWPSAGDDDPVGDIAWPYRDA